MCRKTLRGRPLPKTNPTTHSRPVCHTNAVLAAPFFFIGYGRALCTYTLGCSFFLTFFCIALERVLKNRAGIRCGNYTKPQTTSQGLFGPICIFFLWRNYLLTSVFLSFSIYRAPRAFAWVQQQCGPHVFAVDGVRRCTTPLTHADVQTARYSRTTNGWFLLRPSATFVPRHV